MKVGIVGLGRMGSGIFQRLQKDGHKVIGFDVDNTISDAMEKKGLNVERNKKKFFSTLDVYWLMVPIGKPLKQSLVCIKKYAQKNIIIIEGSNNHFLETQKYAAEMYDAGFNYLDCGISGGLKGKEIGYSLMVGGEKSVYEKMTPLFSSVAGPNSYGYIGSTGSGHYVKMIHNGIEYGLMQAYAEGFHLLNQGSFSKDDINIEQVIRIWQKSSVIRSWLLDLSHDIFISHKNFNDMSGKVAEGGTGLWTVQEAEKNNISVPTIQRSLEVRSWSRKTGGNYATKIVALLRNRFGGHAVDYVNNVDK